MHFKRRHIITVSAVIIAVIVFFVVMFVAGDSAVEIPYTQFIEFLDDGNIISAVISDDYVLFEKKNDSNCYKTDNPGNDTFKETLLLAGVKVKTESSADEIVTFIFDIIINTVILCMIGFAVYRLFVSFYKKFTMIKHTGVHFDDIAGMDNVKKDLIYAADILKHPDKYASRGIRPIKGIILEGPPGNGKTLFAKALAEESGVNFIAAKGADFQSMMMSVGPARVKALFKKAQRHKPCIIFIDEFDGIGEKRSYAGAGIDKENNRMVITLLNEMDGFNSKNGIMVIAATNSYQSLDPAVVRPGRFDVKYTIPYPDKDTIRQLVEIYTKDKKLASDVDVSRLADMFMGLSCAAVETIINEAALTAAAHGCNIISCAYIEEALKKIR